MSFNQSARIAKPIGVKWVRQTVPKNRCYDIALHKWGTHTIPPKAYRDLEVQKIRAEKDWIRHYDW